MNSIYKLISFLGSPLEESSSNVKFSKKEKIELYKLAYKNKIGLFFLQRLKEMNELSPLDKNYMVDMERYRETLKTAINLSSILSKITDKFAIFKFLKPYPHTPSDVDALLFLPKEDCLKIIDYLLNNGYFKIGESPSQTVLYDLRGGIENIDRRTVGGKRGGKFYIDIYYEVSASYIIYINKETLMNHRSKISYSEGVIQTLDPIADLSVVLTHSIIPEQLFTLGDYYTTLYFIKEMNERDLDRLAKIFIENNITKAGIASLSVVSLLHEQVHGYVPDKITYLIDKIGVEGGTKAEKIKIHNNFSFPYKYNISTLIRVLVERMKNEKGLRSILTQAICTANPKNAKWIIYNLILRRTRETY